MISKIRLSNPPRWEFIALLIVGGVLVANLLASPAIGMADNGDFGRMMAKVGVNHLSNDPAGRYFTYFNRIYKVVPATTPLIGDFISSEAFLQQAGVWLGNLFSKDGLWDIRFLGLVHIVALLIGGAYLLVVARGLSILQRALIAALMVLFFSDLRLAAYFNSFYSEPAFVIFFVFWLASALFWIRKPGPGWAPMLLYFFFSGLIVISKTQNTLLGFGFAICGIGLGILRKNRRELNAAVVLSLCLILVMLTFFYVTPQRYKRSNLFNVIFHDILVTSNTTEALQFFGLPEDLSAYRGRDYYMEGGLVHDPEFEKIFFNRLSFSDLLRFYVAHPRWVLEQLDRGAGETFTMRLNFIGNYERESGMPPLSQVNRFTFWSDFKDNVLPKNSLFLTLLYLVCGLGGFLFWVRLTISRPFVLIFWTLVGLTALLYAMTMLVGGMRDPAKQLYSFNYLWDIILGYAAVGLARFVPSIRATKQFIRLPGT